MQRRVQRAKTLATKERDRKTIIGLLKCLRRFGQYLYKEHVVQHHLQTHHSESTLVFNVRNSELKALYQVLSIQNIAQTLGYVNSLE